MAAKKKTTKKAERPPETDTDPTPSAGVEGRSIDGGDAPAAEDQGDEGTFTKVYVIQGEKPEDVTEYERNVIEQARQVGLRATGDVTLADSDTTKERRGSTTRLTFTVEVARASTASATS